LRHRQQVEFLTGFNPPNTLLSGATSLVEDTPGSFQTLPRCALEGEVNAPGGLLFTVRVSSAALPEYPVILLSISARRFRKY
jgi:hypothetical protein